MYESLQLLKCKKGNLFAYFLKIEVEGNVISFSEGKCAQNKHFS